MIRPKLEEIYEFSGAYICTCDLEQLEKKEISLGDKSLTLFTPQLFNNNHRTAHPNVGTIVATFGDTQFEVGQDIICLHTTFQNESKNSKHQYEKDGVLYYIVYNDDVMFGINKDRSLTPRKGILLCEPIKDRLVETTLELPETLIDYRRDVTKILKVWEGCEDFTEGQYIFLEKGGDYLFKYDGVDYIKCDHFFEDIMGVVSGPEVRSEEILLHAKDHSTRTDEKY